MRINVYAEELPDERQVEVVTKEADTGRTFFGVRIFLKSPKELHDVPGDDDRSAIVFWGPRAKVAALLRQSADAIGETTTTTQDEIKTMVDAFLAWPLPDDVCADSIACQPGAPHRTGTNLLTALQARAMFEHCVGRGHARQEGEALNDLIAERKRQVEAEGWTPTHDDEHDNGEMAIAAACYAALTEMHSAKGHPPLSWPWSPEWWKPSADKRRNLVKAGALILAEIERIDRAEGRDA